jgi:hypothetical protein
MHRRSVLARSPKKYKGLPSEISVCGIPHTITYINEEGGCDEGSAPYVGLYDLDKKAILVYTKNKPLPEVLDTLLHEILHGIVITMQLTSLDFSEAKSAEESSRRHRDLARLATLLADTLVRSGLIKLQA